MDKLIRLSDVLALLPETDTVGPKPSAHHYLRGLHLTRAP